MYGKDTKMTKVINSMKFEPKTGGGQTNLTELNPGMVLRHGLSSFH